MQTSITLLNFIVEMLILSVLMSLLLNLALYQFYSEANAWCIKANFFPVV